MELHAHTARDRFRPVCSANNIGQLVCCKMNARIIVHHIFPRPVLAGGCLAFRHAVSAPPTERCRKGQPAPRQEIAANKQRKKNFAHDGCLPSSPHRSRSCSYSLSCSVAGFHTDGERHFNTGLRLDIFASPKWVKQRVKQRIKLPATPCYPSRKTY